MSNLRMRADQMRFYNRICKCNIAAFILHFCASDSVLLSQERYTKKLLKKFGYYYFKLVITSYDAKSKLKKNKGQSISQT